MASKLVVCGGTFDHFHKGHESLLRLAFSSGDRVIVGVTGDEYVQNSKLETRNSKLTESFEVRRQAVLEFVKAEGVLGKVEMVEINDLFGPTLSKDLLIDTIVVSEETRRGAEIINQKREELGLNPLKILIAPQVLAEDEKLISSARIRKGEIDRAGRLYVNPLWLKADLVLSEKLRPEFREPLGKVIKEEIIDNEDQFLVITVGDATTKKFNEKSMSQNVSVIDFKIAREEQFSSFSELGFRGDEQIVRANNPSGHITSDLFRVVAGIFNAGFEKRVILKIEGEEDLAVLPLILCAPLGTCIYYGQPSEGLVKVAVSEDSKNKAYNLVLKLNQT